MPALKVALNVEPTASNGSSAKRWRSLSTSATRGLRRRLQQDHAELLPAVAADHVDPAQAGGQRVGQRAQDVVADQMPEAVVDVLEVVEVDHGQADLAACAPAALDLVGEAVLEAAVIVEAGEAVALHHRAQRAAALGLEPHQRGEPQGLDRLGDEVVAAETPRLHLPIGVLLGRGKMMGSDRCRRDWRIMRASSMPSTPGICTSIKIRSGSTMLRRLSASVGSLTIDTVMPAARRASA